MTFSHQTERAKLRAAPHENVDQEGGHDHDKTEEEMSFEIVRCLYFFFVITCYALFLKSDWFVALLFLLK